MTIILTAAQAQKAVLKAHQIRALAQQQLADHASGRKPLSHAQTNKLHGAIHDAMNTIAAYPAPNYRPRPLRNLILWARYGRR